MKNKKMWIFGGLAIAAGIAGYLYYDKKKKSSSAADVVQPKELTPVRAQAEQTDVLLVQTKK